MANLCERLLPDHASFLARLKPMVADFFAELPQTLSRDAWDNYARTVDEVRIDSFGSAGTRLLLDWMGMPDVSAAFRSRALQDDRVSRLGRLTAKLERPEVTWIRTRCVAWVEFSLVGRAGPIKHEELLCENAYHGEVTGDSRWLRAVTPPFNPFADRRTCCEFRFFDRLIDDLARVGLAGDEAVRSTVCGHIAMLINAPPCVSCIGVMRQFQLLFPRVAMQISGGRSVPINVPLMPAMANCVAVSMRLAAASVKDRQQAPSLAPPDMVANMPPPQSHRAGDSAAHSELRESALFTLSTLRKRLLDLAALGELETKEPLDDLRHRLLEVGELIDVQLATSPEAASQEPAQESRSFATSAEPEAELVLRCREVVVLTAPLSWGHGVEACDDEAPLAADAPRRVQPGRLATALQRWLPNSALARCEVLDFGLLGHLEAPSSGLTLGAETAWGFCVLGWAEAVGAVHWDVLCLRAAETRERSKGVRERCRARTYERNVAQLRRRGTSGSLCLSVLSGSTARAFAGARAWGGEVPSAVCLQWGR